MNEKMEFYKETNFKETAVGRIPNDWEVDTLPKLMNIIDYRGRTPPFSESGIPYIGSDNIRNERIVFDNRRYVSEETYNKYMTRGIPNPGGILFTTEAPLGEVAIIPKNLKFCFAQRLVALQCKNNFNSPFFMYMLRSEFVQRKLRGWATGTTAKGISSKNMKFIEIPYSKDIEEQRKIASILSTIDEAIQKTDEIIAKSQELEKGLMQRLLTKGIGHTKFKKTEIGEIPEEWEVVKLRDVTHEAKSGFACGKRDENGVLQLRMDNIETDGWINTEAGVKVPIPENVEDYLLEPGDTLFNNTNSVDLIGKTAIFRGEFAKCTYSNHLTRIRVNRNKVVPEWILYLLIRKWQLGIFRSICHRHVHQAGINNEDILNLKIPRPDLPEQQKIVDVLQTVDEKIEKERQTAGQLEKTKRWFMQNLLTGEIRVKVD